MKIRTMSLRALMLRVIRGTLYLAMLLWSIACSNNSQQPDFAEADIELPAGLGNIEDGRQEFWQIFCHINEQIGETMPDYRPCEEALIIPQGAPLLPAEAIDRSSRLREVDIIMVPGLGWDCIEEFVGTASGQVHVDALGYKSSIPEIEGISSSARNAQLIYRHLVNNKLLDNGRELVFVGYSKGTPDILEALVTFPHIQQQTLAVVSIAGAVWGTPMADQTPEKMLDAYNLVPGKDCVTVDHGGLESLRPAVRRQWMQNNPLPAGILYYSLVTLPQQDEISRALRSSYKKLSKIDPRNDTQLVYSDQFIPDSKLLAYLRADHLAIAVPIARDHQLIGALAMDKNAFPREILLEAILRQVEADIIAQRNTRVDASVTPQSSAVSD